MNEMSPAIPVIDKGPQTPFTLNDFAIHVPEGRDIRDNRIVGFDNRDQRSRAFNLLRTTLTKKLEEKNARLIGVTSATPAAGKSFLSMNLAASLARVQDAPVYLVDLDLRRGSVGQQIGLEPDVGIAAFLSGRSDNLAMAGRHISDTNMVVFPTAMVKANSAELVSGARFEECISTFRQRTGESIVIFDLPPAFANDDAMLSIQQLDGYVLIVDTGRTTKRQVREVMNLLAPTPCLGTILNRYQGGLADTYGYGYGSSAYSSYYD